MKWSTIAAWFTSACLSPVSSVLAATGAREDHSGVFVWAFLGFCALIVVVQLIPALILLANFVVALVRKPHVQKAKSGK